MFFYCAVDNENNGSFLLVQRDRNTMCREFCGFL